MDKLRKVEHRIKASPAQVRKLVSGGAITLKPANFDPSSRMSIAVMPNTSRRIQTAMRKNKGVRLMLKPNEDIMEDGMEGGKVSLKSVGRDIKRAFTGKKARSVYRQIGKEVAPIAKSIADAGLKAAADQLGERMGNPELASALAGVAKVGLDEGYAGIGREVGFDPNAPVPVIDNPEALKQAIIDKAADNIERRTKGKLRDASLDLLYASTAPKVQQEDMGSEMFGTMFGDGIKVRKTRGGLKVGGASYGMRSMSGGSVLGMSSAGYDMRGIAPAVAPSSIIQLGGPFQRIQSPAMSPFIAASPQLANKAISGGSFLPSGARRGNGFNPAG